MTPLPSGTVTFLFTDIEGSTGRWERHPAAMQAAMRRHDALIRRAIEAQGGHVFKTVGDAFCAVFETPHAALDASITALRALRTERWEGIDDLPVRMSLNSGVADERDRDYFGPVVNRVARLLHVAHGNQILVSSTTAALVGGGLPKDVSLLDLGAHRLRDLGRAEHIFQVRHPELPDTFPSIRSMAAFPNNLPAQISSFVGRERALERSLALLRSTRLLTLTGIGGTGKTRLALQLAAERIEDYPDGVWLVSLAPISEASLVTQSVATPLGLVESPGQTIEAQLCEHLQTRKLLLLLDNCEHLLEAAASLVQRLLQSSPGLSVLCTSREPLHIAGERVWPVPPLTLPSIEEVDDTTDLDSLASNEALRLFIERAGSVKPGFGLTRENAAAVLEICRRLDGIALAIELAATRVRAMSPQQLAARLAHRFRLLTGGSRTALPHQQTLRAALDWSYDLLDAREQRLFRRLSIFADGWALASAEAICSDLDPQPDAIEDWEVLDLATQLVDKSLVGVDAEADMRSLMLETVREYGREKLEASGELDRIGQRHASHFLELAREASEGLTGPRSSEWLARLDLERANLRRAMAWAIEVGDAALGLGLSGSLWRYWYTRGSFVEGCEELEQALAIPDGEVAGTVRAEALHGLGTLATYQGDYHKAQIWLERGLECWRAAGDESGAARTTHNLAIVAHEQGNFDTARTLMEAYLASSVAANAPLGMAVAHSNIGTTALELGDLDTAESSFRASLRINREIENAHGIAMGLRDLGTTLLDRGDYSEAERLVSEALESSRKIGDQHGIAECLVTLGEIAQRQGELEKAHALYEESLALERAMGNPRSIALVLGFLGQLSLDAGELETAGAKLAASLEILETIGHKRSLASTLDSLAQVQIRSGDPAAARSHLLPALRLRREMASPLHLLGSIETLAGLAMAEQRPDIALRLAGAAESLRQKLGTPLPPARRPAMAAFVDRARGELGQAGAEAATAEGRAMGLEAALACGETLLAQARE